MQSKVSFLLVTRSRIFSGRKNNFMNCRRDVYGTTQSSFNVMQESQEFGKNRGWTSSIVGVPSFALLLN